MREWLHLAAGPGSAIGCADGGALAEPQLRRAEFTDGNRTIPSRGRKGPPALLQLIGTLLDEQRRQARERHSGPSLGFGWLA
jgi:hypothetical protein